MDAKTIRFAAVAAVVVAGAVIALNAATPTDAQDSPVVEGEEVEHAVGSSAQESALSDGRLSFEEYEAALVSAISCARDQGVTVSDPVLGFDGVTLDYSVSETGVGEKAIVIFDECYEVHAHAVDLAFQGSEEVADRRTNYIDQMHDCVFGGGTASDDSHERTMAVMGEATVRPEFEGCRAAATQGARALTVSAATDLERASKSGE